MILLDTNVVSELMRPRPEPAVLDWVASVPRRDLYISAIVAAELLFGVASLPAGKKQNTLKILVEQTILEDFRGQILAFDLAAARCYAEILQMRRRIGQPVKEMDAMIAATAAVHSATIVTRNVRDFEHCGVALFNPWPDPEENLI